jgi:hypothetical protein
MGWGRWALLGDVGQQLSIGDLQTNLDHTRLHLTRQMIRDRSRVRRVEALQAECDELKMYVAALIRLLVSKGMATQEEVASMVDAIDLEDGLADRKNPKVLPTPKGKIAMRPDARPSRASPARSRRTPRRPG